MFKRYFKIITENATWKLLSFAIAVLLWFIVRSISNPIKTESFVVPLRIENKDAIERNQYILKNEDELLTKNIIFSIRASISALSDLRRNQSNFEAYVDLKPINISMTDKLGSELNADVKYRFPPNLNKDLYEVKNYEDKTVDLILDKEVEKEFPIVVEKNGDGTQGFVSLTPTVSPEVVSLKGPKSMMDSVDHVFVTIDLRSVSSDIKAVRKIQVLSNTGENITDYFEFSRETAEVFVGIDKYEKLQILTPTIQGEPSNGYMLEAVIYEPKYVEVVGNIVDIKKIKSISLPTINVQDKKESFKKEVDLNDYFKNTNVQIKNGTQSVAVITAIISREAVHTFDIPLETIKIEGMKSPFEFIDKKLSVTLKGKQENIDKIAVKNLTPSINVSSLETGVQEVSIDLHIPDGVVLVGEKPSLKIEILEDRDTSATPSTQIQEEINGIIKPPVTDNSTNFSEQ